MSIVSSTAETVENQSSSLASSLTYDDVLLKPQYSEIASRSDVDLTMIIGSGNRARTLSLPIISAPMDTVTAGLMAGTVAANGGMGIIHRYCSIDEQLLELEFALSLAGESSANVGAAIGATGDWLDRYQALILAGCSTICIDVAHGDHIAVKQALHRLSQFESRDFVHIMTGNIATREAMLRTEEWGADSVRVGVGGGATCSTRIGTGHGVPNIQSLIWAKGAKSTKCSIIADGGIKKTGDAVKAFAFGADAVMLGSMLAGSSCVPNYSSSGVLFRGMASRDAQESWRGKKVAAAEGVTALIPSKGETIDLLSEIKGLIQSGCAYSGIDRLLELSSIAQFVIQTQSGLNESRPHVSVL